MTSNGILLNNALSNFAPDSEGAKGSNSMSAGRRPLFLGAPALAIDTDEICGQRMLLGGASADILGQVQ